MHRITNFLRGSKGRDRGLILLIFLAGFGGFGLGRLSATDSLKPPMTITGAGAVIADNNEQGGEVVASKNGDTYHFPWCPGAVKIKEENKIWFDSPEEAQSAGLHAAGNCKGVQ